MIDKEDTLLPETIARVREHQRRCVECGNASQLELHHRIFRSTKHTSMQLFLEECKLVYEATQKKKLLLRGMHDRQNLVMLCRECHSSIHSGNKLLREKYRNSFTCPTTGYNVSYEKNTSLY